MVFFLVVPFNPHDITLLTPLYLFKSDEWMKKNGFTDEIITKEEDERKMQFQGATIKDLDLPVAVTVSAEVCFDFLRVPNFL